MSRCLSLGLLLALCATASPAQARRWSLPAPLGLSMGLSVAKAEALLRAAGAAARTHRSPSRAWGQTFERTKIKAKLPQGPIRRVKLYFIADRLARLKVYGRDRQAFPVNAKKLGKPFRTDGRSRVWVSAKRLQGIRCRPGKCDLMDESMLIAAGLPEDKVRKRFARKLQQLKQSASSAPAAP